jgi:hypothetical protein
MVRSGVKIDETSDDMRSGSERDSYEQVRKDTA